VRAVQTAELVATGLGATCAVDVAVALSPGESPRALIKALEALPADAAVMLFGHEPGLSAIAALLLDDPTFSGLDKAEAVRITSGQLRWRFAWNAEAPATTP